jgi:hypothetical protein
MQALKIKELGEYLSGNLQRIATDTDLYAGLKLGPDAAVRLLNTNGASSAVTALDRDVGREFPDLIYKPSGRNRNVRDAYAYLESELRGEVPTQGPQTTQMERDQRPPAVQERPRPKLELVETPTPREPIGQRTLRTTTPDAGQAARMEAVQDIRPTTDQEDTVESKMVARRIEEQRRAAAREDQRQRYAQDEQHREFKEINSTLNKQLKVQTEMADYLKNMSQVFTSLEKDGVKIKEEEDETSSTSRSNDSSRPPQNQGMQPNRDTPSPISVKR